MVKNKGKYNGWLEGYLARGKQLESVLGQTIEKICKSGKTLLALPELRAARASFPHPFCLCLYSSRFDEALSDDLLAETKMKVSDKVKVDFPEMVTKTAGQALSIVIPLLDARGIHLVLLERANEEVPDGPH